MAEVKKLKIAHNVTMPQEENDNLTQIIKENDRAAAGSWFALQGDLKKEMRPDTIEFMDKVVKIKKHEDQGDLISIFLLAISIFERFLSKVEVSRRTLQEYACASVRLADKLVAVDPLLAEDFLTCIRGLTGGLLQEAESRLLNVVWRDLQFVTAASVVYLGLTSRYGVEKKPHIVVRMTESIYKSVVLKPGFCGASQAEIGGGVLLAFLRSEGKSDAFYKETFEEFLKELNTDCDKIIGYMNT